MEASFRVEKEQCTVQLWSLQLLFELWWWSLDPMTLDQVYIGMFLNKLILSPSNVSPDASLPLQKPFCAHRNKILGVFLHHSNIILQLLYVVLLQYSCFFACWHLSSDRLYNIFELSCLFIPPGSFELSLSFSVKLCFQMLVQIMLHARVILYVPAGSSRP